MGDLSPIHLYGYFMKILYKSYSVLFALTIIFFWLTVFVRSTMFHETTIMHHHETVNVTKVYDCYSGEIDICKIDVIDRFSIVDTIEVRFIVEEQMPLYKHCWYVGYGQLPLG